MPTSTSLFAQLGLQAELCQAINDLGFTDPTPIQEQSIPLLLAGRDVLARAQTGTGKTAAFALPGLMQLEIERRVPQILVLAPTRELALQVAEACRDYGRHLRGLKTLAVYGGQGMGDQLRALKQGVHVVVGTPGRIMDHLRRGTLNLDNIRLLVLDEADEMLNMGFSEDVEWILEKAPAERQLALFSATMPNTIRRIAQRFMNDAEEINLSASKPTLAAIEQRYWIVPGPRKLEATLRLLETEDPQAMLIFARTRGSTVDIAEQLSGHGYSAAALNGDMPQATRERTISKLKSGALDILVATDVAARGLDVERISHVLNYDMPTDAEIYVHRIGRTGRAGRTGKALLFVSPREQRTLRNFEYALKQPITACELPTAADLSKRRVERFKQRLADTLTSTNIDLDFYRNVIEEFCHDQPEKTTTLDIAAALITMAQGEQPLQIRHKKMPDFAKPARTESTASERVTNEHRKPNKKAKRDKTNSRDVVPMVRYRLEVGRKHEVRPGDIVGAIANEAELESKYIGRIDLFDDYSTVDLPEGMPREILRLLRKTWIRGQKINIALLEPVSTVKPAPKEKHREASEAADPTEHKAAA